MNLVTPLKLIQCLYSRKARKAYGQSLRQKVWDMAGKDRLLPCKIEGRLRMIVHRADQSSVSRSVFINGTFEPEELAFIRHTVKPGMIAVDVGANIGVHSLVLADCIGDSGKVHAFEPSAAFERLSNNIALNRFQSRFQLNRCALGETDGKIELFFCPPGHEAYTSAGKPLHDLSQGRKFEVDLLTLDNYCRFHNIPRIDFMKMDIEGYEVAVLNGCKALLKTKSIRVLMFEVNDVCLQNCGYSGEDLFNLLHAAGYETRILRRGTQELVPCQIPPSGTGNIVFARPL